MQRTSPVVMSWRTWHLLRTTIALEIALQVTYAAAGSTRVSVASVSNSFETQTVQQPVYFHDSGAAEAESSVGTIFLVILFVVLLAAALGGVYYWWTQIRGDRFSAEYERKRHTAKARPNNDMHKDVAPPVASAAGLDPMTVELALRASRSDRSATRAMTPPRRRP